MENVFEELEEDMGKVLCVLPGWEEDDISGPNIEDPDEIVGIPVAPVDTFNQLTPEQLKAAMMNSGFGDMCGDDDDDDDEEGPEPEGNIEEILDKIRMMQVQERKAGKKGKKK